MRNYSAPGHLPHLKKARRAVARFPDHGKSPRSEKSDVGKSRPHKKTNSFKKTKLLRKLHVATVSEEDRQRYLPEPVVAGAGSSGTHKKTNSSKKTRKLRKPLVATVAENVGADNVGTEELGHIKKTNSFKKTNISKKTKPPGSQKEHRTTPGGMPPHPHSRHTHMSL